MRFRHLLFLALVSAALAQPGEPILRIPPVTASFDAGGQPVTVTAWGSLSRVSADVFRLKLTADLGDFQRNITPFLRSQLDRSDRCGERLSIEQARLAPAPPDSLLDVTVHYERWGCMKAFGKQMAKKLVGGNGVLRARLTPSLDANAVSLKAEVIGIEADGSLGELLRSGPVGDALKQKIANSVQSAIQKAATFDKVLPPEIANVVTIRSVEFTRGREGRLCLETTAEAHISPDRLKALGERLQPR